MRHLGDGPFHKGDPIWVIGPNGNRHAAEYVGDTESGAWFGGSASAYVLLLESETTVAVQLDQVLARKG